MAVFAHSVYLQELLLQTPGALERYIGFWEAFAGTGERITTPMLWYGVRQRPAEKKEE